MGDTFYARLVLEHEELLKRLNKLSQFIGTDAFKALDDENKRLLMLQHAQMVDLTDTLWKRRRLIERQARGKVEA